MKSRYSNYAPSLLSDEQVILIARKVQSEIIVFTENEFCVTEHAAIQKHLEHYDELNSRHSDTSIAERTRKSDKKRRRYLTSLKRALLEEIEEGEDSPESSKAAETIYTVIDNNPVQHNISYDEESVQMKQLFAELDKLTDEFELLAAKRNYAKLKSEQGRFDQLREDKLTQSTNTPVGSVRVPIDAMVFHIEGVLSYIERRVIGGDTLFEASAINLEKFTNDLMIVARKRKTEADAE